MMIDVPSTLGRIVCVPERFCNGSYDRLGMGCTSIALVAMRLGDTTLMRGAGSADRCIDGSTVRLSGITLRVIHPSNVHPAPPPSHQLCVTTLALSKVSL